MVDLKKDPPFFLLSIELKIKQNYEYPTKNYRNTLSIHKDVSKTIANCKKRKFTSWEKVDNLNNMVLYCKLDRTWIKSH